jgi:hypothetical protein
MYYHSILPKPLYTRYLAAGCHETNNASPQCQSIVAEMGALVSGMDPYGLNFPVCNTPSAAGRQERYFISRIMRAHAEKQNQTHLLAGPYFPENFQACQDNWSAAYLSRADVQAAIHAKPISNWASCNGPVNSRYNVSDTTQPMMPLYKKLIDGKYGLRMLVYSGDDDIVCSTVASQEWIWGLNYPVVRAWQPWKLDGQVAGFAVRFEGFDFTTIHGAGHMVPEMRPYQSLEMLKMFLKNGPW